MTQPNRMRIDGLKSKDLVGIPWRVAFALQAYGWYLRSDVIWAKPNPMPESVTDRPTKAHEYLFLLAKSATYYYDAAAIFEPYVASTLREVEDGYNGLGLKDYESAGVQNPSETKRRIIESVKRKNEQSGDRRKVGFNDRWDNQRRLIENDERIRHDQPPRKAERVGENGRNVQTTNSEAERRDQAGSFNNNPHLRPDVGRGRNKRTVWTIPTQPFPGAHFATMPEALVEPCILAGTKAGDVVLDPFCGSGTVGVVCAKAQRQFIGIELNGEYVKMAEKRIAAVAPLFSAEAI